jgi:ankyrin repeat protein
MDFPPVRAYAGRCFATCSADGERAVMQRNLHSIISRALADGRLREIDWRSEPTPPLDPQEVARETAALTPRRSYTAYNASDNLSDACEGSLYENEDAVDVARRALDFGAPIDDGLDGTSLSPLAVAILSRAFEVANFLLDRGAKATTDALIWACVRNGGVDCPLELVERLLKAGADVRGGGSTYFRDGNKFTPLYHAVNQLRDNVPLARLLLDYGAPVDLGRVNASTSGMQGLQTPLCWACEHGEVAMARLLLARGAGWDKITHSDPSPFCAERATPLLSVRHKNTLRSTILPLDESDDDEFEHPDYPNFHKQHRLRVRQMNDLFDDFLAHYWTLRVALRLFQRRENHASGPQRLVLGDAYLPNKIGAFVVGDGILVKKKK